jgi:hypothetical protein
MLSTKFLRITDSPRVRVYQCASLLDAILFLAFLKNDGHLVRRPGVNGETKFFVLC